MRIERAVNYVETLGPGKRLCVWVNGCSRRCVGCVSARLQRIDESTEVQIEEYFLGYNLQQTDGVTVSGGEPFEQIDELYKLVRYFRRRGVRDILVYTGFTLQELREMNSEKIEGILNNISVLIDGPYIEKLDGGAGNLKGSDNQQIYYLDETLREKYEKYLSQERKMQEIEMANVLLGVGIPDREYIEQFNENKFNEEKH